MMGIAIALLLAFVLWTAAVCLVDTAPIDPEESTVGFSSMNHWVHAFTGVHMALYNLTDWLSLIPVAVSLCFALPGLMQWIKRKHFLRVDFSILALGGFYLAVMAAYVFFEAVVINYRPVLIDGVLEGSYPSSTTLLVLCVMPTAMQQFNCRIRRAALRRGTAAITGFILFMVIARLVSGVHWFSDIIGGALLSAGLVAMYHAIQMK